MILLPEAGIVSISLLSVSSSFVFPWIEAEFLLIELEFPLTDVDSSFRDSVFFFVEAEFSLTEVNRPLRELESFLF